MTNKEKAELTVKMIQKRRRKKEIELMSVQIGLVDNCMRKSAYCTTKRNKSRIGQI